MDNETFILTRKIHGDTEMIVYSVLCKNGIVINESLSILCKKGNVMNEYFLRIRYITLVAPS